MDPVNHKALKGKFKDREDKDIDNNGKVDSSDEYLHKRRQAVSKAIGKIKEETLDEKRGLWDNIHAKRKRIEAGSGERMRKPGSKGAPTDADFKNASESNDLKQAFIDSMQSKLKKRSPLRDPNAKTAREEDKLAKQLAAKQKMKEEVEELDEAEMSLYDKIKAARANPSPDKPVRGRGSKNYNPKTYDVHNTLDKEDDRLQAMIKKKLKRESVSPLQKIRMDKEKADRNKDDKSKTQAQRITDKQYAGYKVKLKTEETQLDEAETMYVIKHKKTKQVLNTHSDYATAKDEHEGLGADKHEYGVYKQTKKDAALRNRNTYRESVELDELSAVTLGKYSQKARTDALDHSGGPWGKKKDPARVAKRLSGDAMAVKKLDKIRKEETQLDEIQISWHHKTQKYHTIKHPDGSHWGVFDHSSYGTKGHEIRKIRDSEGKPIKAADSRRNHSTGYKSGMGSPSDAAKEWAKKHGGTITNHKIKEDISEAKDGDGVNIVRDREFKGAKFKFKSHPYGSPEWHANKDAYEKFKAKEKAKAQAKLKAVKESLKLDEVSTEKLRDYASAALQDKNKAKADKRWKYASKAMDTVADREVNAAHARKYNKMEEVTPELPADKKPLRKKLAQFRHQE